MLSTRDKAKILKLCTKGDTYASIAAKFGVSPSRIYLLAKAAGLPPRQKTKANPKLIAKAKKLRAQGKTYAQIAVLCDTYRAQAWRLVNTVKGAAGDHPRA